jgi:hypothetical protein
MFRISYHFIFQFCSLEQDNIYLLVDAFKPIKKVLQHEDLIFTIKL